MLRSVSAGSLVLLALACSGTSDGCEAIDDRIDELERELTPAAAWDDIVELQDDIVERGRLRAERRKLDC